jgi:hypothetical protein
LNARTATQGNILIVKNLNSHIVCLDDQKVGTPAETWVNL